MIDRAEAQLANCPLARPRPRSDLGEDESPFVGLSRVEAV